jgi:hypothetical protein
MVKLPVYGGAVEVGEARVESFDAVVFGPSFPFTSAAVVAAAAKALGGAEALAADDAAREGLFNRGASVLGLSADVIAARFADFGVEDVL